MPTERQSLLDRLDKLRILETSFTTIYGARKTHYLLTDTPKRIRIADEQYQLSEQMILDLFKDIRHYIANSKPIEERK